jgi:thioredoxin reductase (NADPH)
MKNNGNYDVIIVGAAAAGISAGIYSARQGMKTLIIGKDLGGQALLANDIQNYPGYEKIDGFSLISKFEAQARKFGAEIIYDEVQKVSIQNGVFLTKTNSKEYSSSTIILAFGKTPRDLGVPGEDKFKGRGLSYCATCDGPLFREKNVAVIGSAEYALDAAVMLSDLAKKVYLVSTRDKLIGDENLVANLSSKDNVAFISNSNVKEIIGETRIEAVLTSNLKKNSEERFEVDGVFVELGYIAKTELVKDLVKLNERKEIIIDKECGTSRPGVFAAGDVTDTPFKQVIISSGQGAIAALSSFNYIQKLRGKSTIRGDWKSKK